MKRSIGIGFLTAVLIAFSAQSGHSFQKPAKVPAAGFPAVAVIFKTDCMPCHTATNHAGGYDLSTYAAVMKQGAPTIVAGNPAKSLLVAYLKGTKQPAMPMRRPALSPAKIKTISDWIKAGAKNK